MEKRLFPRSIKDHKVFSFQYDGYWTDIGNISSFFEANLALTKDIPPFNFFDNSKKVYTRSRMLPPAKISGSRMENTLAADGCIIHARTYRRLCHRHTNEDWSRHYRYRLLPDGK